MCELRKMRLFLYFFLAGFSVQMCICDTAERSYYVVEMSDPSDEEPVIREKREFKVYWNVPTMQCLSKKIPFNSLFDKYGIIQNKEDKFRGGDKVTILYDPGLFPALLSTSSAGEYRFRNGGVPQEGSVQKHLDAFKSDVEAGIPDKDYDGVAVIDFESWRPIFRQNFGTLAPYISVSYDIERKEHWWWPKSWIESTAKERYERAGRIFMEATISLAKQLRPKATWGYYAYPYCFNSGPDCSTQVHKENDAEPTQEASSFYDESWYDYGTNIYIARRESDFDNLQWLWMQSTGLFPSLYSSTKLRPRELADIVRGRLAEADRVRQNNARVLPYVWFRYRDGGYFRKEDLAILLETIFKSNASGFIVWGGSSDVNTKEKCNALLDYVTKTFGPAIARYTKEEKRKDEEIQNDEQTTAATTFVTSSVEFTQSDEDKLATEVSTTAVNKLTSNTQNEASTEASNAFNTTQDMESVSDFLETASKVKQDSLSGEIVLNSIIQFFDMADANSSLSDPSEPPEYTQNPDDTPGYTQHGIEQELKSDINYLSENNEPSSAFKRKDIIIPHISPLAKILSTWKNQSSSTPNAYSTTAATTEITSKPNTPGNSESENILVIVNETSPNPSTEATTYSTTEYSTDKSQNNLSTVILHSNSSPGDGNKEKDSNEISSESSTDTSQKKLPTLIPQFYLSISDDDIEKDSNEILESLTKLTGSFDEASVETSTMTKIKDEEDELFNAKILLQDLTDAEKQDLREITDAPLLDSNKQTSETKTDDEITSAENLSSDVPDDKFKNKYDPDELEDDIILEAVAEILNTTIRTEVNS